MERKAAISAFGPLDVPLGEDRPGWRLRTLGEEDVPMLRRVARDDREATGRELPWPPASADDDGAGEWVADHLAGRRGRVGALGIFDPDGDLHGGVNLLAHDPVHRSLQLGVWLKTSAEGSGLMTTACHVALLEVAEQLGVRRVVWHCEPGNRRSRAVADRLGFRYEGRQRSAHARPDGSRYDLDVLSRVVDELPGRP